MSHQTGKLSFFRRLAKDPTANTVVISAAALVPLMAMVGGGVDASRYYMTVTRLQAACDAGALAARRAMDDDIFRNSHRNTGRNFFDQNFADGQFGLQDLSREYVGTDDGEVLGTASGTLPAAIMDAFGYEEFEIDVECTADINISNTDVMFVLDVTGSMNCQVNDSSCTNNGEVEATDSMIDNLRASVLTFYDTVEAATSDSAQVRYGIMPYSNQVNVGYSLNRAWLANSHTYQSREADWLVTTTPGTYNAASTEYTRTGGAGNWRFQNVKTRSWPGITLSQCQTRANNPEFDIYRSSNEATWTQVSQSGTDPRITTFTGTVTYEYYATNWSYSQTYSGGTCTLNQDFWLYDATSTITRTEGYEEGEEIREFRWAYRPVTFDLTTLYDDNTFTAPTGWDEAEVAHQWNGCIEEAATITTGTWNPVPVGAYDLDIDLVPTSEAQKWKPMLPSLSYPRFTDDTTNLYNSAHWTQADVISTANKAQPPTYCPKPARKLAPFADRTELQNWISEANGFVARGSTYHDFGMIWGARFISPDGIFAAENDSAPNGDAITRHIVFMTDGAQSTSQYIYGLYGLEWWDRRVTGDGSQSLMADRHASRFQAACKAARNKNISVWVVAFGTTLTQNLIDCATPGRAYQASNSAALDAAFQEIAEKIAALRLTD